MKTPRLIILTGLSGTGKTSIAEAVARELDIPVFAKDWLEATVSAPTKPHIVIGWACASAAFPAGTNWTGRKSSASERITHRGMKNA
jgi:hypothetical protein